MTGNFARSDKSPSWDDSFWSLLIQPGEESPEPPQIAGLEKLWTEINTLIAQRSRSVVASPAAVSRGNPWQVAQELQDADQVLELTVSGRNRGGLLVRWNGLQGFVPASQLLDFSEYHLATHRESFLEARSNGKLKLKILEVDEDARRLILSERAALVSADQRRRLLEKIRPGKQVTGVITNVTDFGAFVDLGGVEGLIHISELSWSRVSHPAELLRPGESVNVQVLGVDAQQQRISLSLKQMRPDPWQRVDQRYRPGLIVEGVISNVVSFGAFVQLEEELEGLIHRSELAEGARHPREVVKRGDYVAAEVLQVDGPARRLALRLHHIISEKDIR